MNCKILYCGISIFLLVILAPIYGTVLSLKNYSADKSLWVYIKRVSSSGIDWLVRDYETKLNPYSVLETSGNFTGIWVIPMSKNMLLDDFKNKISRELGNPKDLNKSLCEMAEKEGLYQAIGNGLWEMSYDEDILTRRPYLYFGRFKISEPFEFLVISDVHTIADSEQALLKMDMKHYGGDQNRDSQIQAFRVKDAVLQQMAASIVTKPKNIQAVILPGDCAGGYGKKSEKNAFESFWAKPLEKLLGNSNGGNLFIGIGNHDTYWSSFFEPRPTSMLRFIEDRHSSYLYSFNIGKVRFIHLGLCSLSTKAQNEYFNTSMPSLFYLAQELKKSYGQPVVIYFHYPIHGPYADWWSKEEKDRFYNAIRNYNVIVILNGHAHSTAVYDFRGKCPSIRAGGNEFAEFRFDPAYPNRIFFKFINSQGNERFIEPKVNAPEG